MLVSENKKIAIGKQKLTDSTWLTCAKLLCNFKTRSKAGIAPTLNSPFAFNWTSSSGNGLPGEMRLVNSKWRGPESSKIALKDRRGYVEVGKFWSQNDEQNSRGRERKVERLELLEGGKGENQTHKIWLILKRTKFLFYSDGSSPNSCPVSYLDHLSLWMRTTHAMYLSRLRHKGHTNSPFTLYVRAL